ncbi:hypothetical protein LB505_003339 [Fusarium chuoi]|nr:hypothetical protein LB505_003339 [Fusarium chuoi]
MLAVNISFDSRTVFLVISDHNCHAYSDEPHTFLLQVGFAHDSLRTTATFNWSGLITSPII